MGERPRLELFAGLASLHRSQEYSDLVIYGNDGSRFPVHRAILCPRSAYFRRVVEEGLWKDATPGHVVLVEDDEVIRLLVEYFYLLDYDPHEQHSEDENSHGDSSDTMSAQTEPGQYGHVYGASAISVFGGPVHHASHSAVFRSRTDSPLTVHALPAAGSAFIDFTSTTPPRRRKAAQGMVTNAPEPSPLASREPNLILHARLYAAGAKYGIDGLKALSLDKFKIQLTRHWDSPELAEAIHVVYSSTPLDDKGMRDAIADMLGWHARLLDKPEIETAIMEINGLAYELLKRSRRAEPEYD